MQEGKLDLKDKLSLYLQKDILAGLHVYKGIDYSYELTIEHLISQTSGLPDFYLEGAGSIFSRVKRQDFSYTFEDELNWIKSMKPHFVPGTKTKAYYTDVNFDLLGKIIEVVSGSSLQEAYEQYIFAPLNMKSTYLAGDDSDLIPHTYQVSHSDCIGRISANLNYDHTCRYLRRIISTFRREKHMHHKKMSPAHLAGFSFFRLVIMHSDTGTLLPVTCVTSFYIYSHFLSPSSSLVASVGLQI